jgi:hypothetical protein
VRLSVTMNLKNLFTEHPASVGETYTEHARNAASFGVLMLLGALACFLHAVIPAFCTSTGSRIVGRLHNRMIANRFKPESNRQPAPQTADFFAEHI